MRRISVKFFMVAALIIAVLPSAGISASAAPKAPVGDSYFFDFGLTVKPWSPAADRIAVTEHTLVLKEDNRMFGGTYAALTTAEPGMVWMTHIVPAGKTNMARVSFIAKSFWGKTIVPVVYIASTKPIGTTGFKPVAAVLGTNWTGYSLEVPAKGDFVVVCIGYKTDNSAWAGIDNVNIELFNQANN